jgi:hypothetical protein
MARFAVTRMTPGGATLSIIALAGVATSRPIVNYFSISSPATPANLAGEFALLRFTAAPVGGTTLVPEQIDPASPPPLCVGKGGTMTEPTYVSGAGQEYWGGGVNQQATFQWWANPGYEPRTAVGTANGIGLRSIAYAGGTPNIKGTIMWEE